jgi:hypothetical protein
MEPEVSLQRSQEPIIVLYPDPILFSSRPYQLYFKIHFNIMLPPMLGSLMCVTFPAWPILLVSWPKQNLMSKVKRKVVPVLN